MFFIFQKIKLFNPKLKKLLLFRRTNWFSLLFSGLFIADCICLIQVSLFHHWFCYCFSSVFISPTFFTVPVFLPGTSFLCCCTTSATDLRELCLLSDVFYLKLLPDIWHNLLLSRFPWGQQFRLEAYRVSHWGSKHRLGHLFVWITQFSAKGTGW